MLESGFHITQVHQGYAGSNTWYTWETEQGATGAAEAEECRAKFAPYREKTPEELRVVYDRWVSERLCLVTLGYDPAAPPSFEKFVSDWKTGPWMPIDGIDTGAWSDTAFTTAKHECGLEMYDR